MPHAGAGVGGTPRGRSSTCEQRERCPTLPKIPVAWDRQCEQLPLETSNQCVHPEVPTSTLTPPLLWHPPPPLQDAKSATCRRVKRSLKFFVHSRVEQVESPGGSVRTHCLRAGHVYPEVGNALVVVLGADTGSPHSPMDYSPCLVSVFAFPLYARSPPVCIGVRPCVSPCVHLLVCTPHTPVVRAPACTALCAIWVPCVCPRCTSVSVVYALSPESNMKDRRVVSHVEGYWSETPSMEDEFLFLYNLLTGACKYSLCKQTSPRTFVFLSTQRMDKQRRRPRIMTSVLELLLHNPDLIPLMPKLHGSDQKRVANELDGREASARATPLSPVATTNNPLQPALRPALLFCTCDLNAGLKCRHPFPPSFVLLCD